MTEQTALVAWDPNSGAALPAYLADAMGDLGSNITDRDRVPSLSYEGKTWTVVKDGNKTKLQAKNSDGDMVPIPIMRAVILSFNPDRGRSYYPGAYNPAATAQPDCWSSDGKTPDASSKVKQASACNGCPMSIKGSKVEQGQERVACSSHRMVAVAPAFDLGHDPLRLKLAVTSDYDKEVVEHGWYAFRQYSDFLKSRGISHTALVVTKMKFDPNPAYPKILFALDRLLSPEEVVQVKQTLAGPKVAELLAEKWSAAGTNGTQTNERDIMPYGLEGAYADGWQPHPDSAGYSWKGQEVLPNEALAAKYPAPVAPPLPAAQQIVDVPAETLQSPHAQALADGWLDHPAAPGFMYKGQEVLATDAVLAKFPVKVPPAPVLTGAPAAPPIPPAPVSAPVAPPVIAYDPLVTAAANGWQAHPAAPGYWYLGQEVILEADLAARYPGPAVVPVVAAQLAPPAAPPAPVAPPVVMDPMGLALADGWVAHPAAPGYHYKGQDVKPDADVAAMYAGNAAAAAAPTPPIAPAGSAPPAEKTTSPSSPPAGGATAIPADVQGLLDKWSGS